MKLNNINNLLTTYPETLLKSALEKIKSEGYKVIGYTCIYVPEELLITEQTCPIRIIPSKNINSKYVPSFVCPVARAILNNILDLKDYIDAVIISHTCDPMWRLYDILKWKFNKPVFILRVPHNIDDTSRNFYINEIFRLKTFVEKFIINKFLEDTIINAIYLCNRARRITKEVYYMHRMKSLLSNYQLFNLILLGFIWKKEDYIKFSSSINIDKYRYHGTVRLHVSGSSVFDTEIFKIIDECGGIVVSDDLCTGSRYLDIEISNLNDDVIRNLCLAYLDRPPCPALHPLNDRLDYTKTKYISSNADGVMVISTSSCDPILYDYVHIRRMFREMNVPVIHIDYESVSREYDRLKTRIKAFMESLGV